MLEAARGDRVRELGEACFAHHVHVLHLDVGWRLARAFEEDVDAAVGAVLHLAAQAVVAFQRRNTLLMDGLGDERVRVVRVGNGCLYDPAGDGICIGGIHGEFLVVDRFDRDLAASAASYPTLAWVRYLNARSM